ncbi:NAD(P)H-dependent oxidoreductase subunit E [Peptococcaceae bacterium 1198_IL3148]
MNTKNQCQCNSDQRLIDLNEGSELTEGENTIKPAAKHQVLICLGTSCHLRGSAELLEQLIAELCIQPGEVTPDGLFSLNVARCLGACAIGPVMMVDEVLYPNMNSDKISKILEQYRK